MSTFVESLLVVVPAFAAVTLGLAILFAVITRLVMVVLGPDGRERGRPPD
jgi:UPF0716 family protein affecting phage T7 exclusion